MKILANIFGFLGMSLLLGSTFCKDKKSMLKMQVGDASLNTLGGLFIGSYSSMIMNLVACIRNILNIKDKNTTSINIMLILISSMIGVCVNSKGLVGLLPIIASVEYTLLSFKLKSAQGLRFALLANSVLWSAQ